MAKKKADQDSSADNTEQPVPAPTETSEEAPPRLTSRQLKSAVRAHEAAKLKRSAKIEQKPPGRPVVVEHWARGRMHDALVVAFVSEHRRQRTVKHTPAEWMDLFRAWLKQPR